jgi:hypothetical protein
MQEVLTGIDIPLRARNVKIPQRLSILNIPEASVFGVPGERSDTIELHFIANCS